MLKTCNDAVATGRYYTDCRAQVDYLLSLNTDHLSIIEFNVDPPSRQLRRDDILICGTFDVTNHFLDCTVNNVLVETPINVDFIYNKTYGIYYESLEGGNINQFYSQPLEGESGLFGNMKIEVSAQSIPFTLNVKPVDVCDANTPPNAPSITLTPTTLIVGEEATITFSATDSQNELLAYQIDWGDGVLTTVTSPLVKSWTTAGTKTVKIRALDVCGESAWITKTIIVTDPPTLDTLTLTAVPSCGSVTLNWNDNTATSYQVFRKEGDESYVAISPLLSTTSFVDNITQDRQRYTYKIWSNKDTFEKYSNVVSAIPTCPCVAPRVVNTSDGLCHDPITALCVPSPLFTAPGGVVTWAAVGITGGTGIYTFSWT